MSWIATTVREIWGLFVEDGSFAAAIALWLLAAAVVLPAAHVPVQWRGPALALGLAAILIENVRRSARR